LRHGQGGEAGPQGADHPRDQSRQRRLQEREQARQGGDNRRIGIRRVIAGAGITGGWFVGPGWLATHLLTRTSVGTDSMRRESTSRGELGGLPQQSTRSQALL